MRKLPQPQAGSKNVRPPSFAWKLPERRETAPATAIAHPLELGVQVIHEQRLDHLEDVFLGRVVRPLRPALRRVHDRLEERAEDRRRNVRPVEAAGVEQRPAHRGVEREHPQMSLEQVAVDVGEPRQVLVESRRALVLQRVEHFEQLREPRPEIGPVLARARLDEVEEDVARLEYPGVVGEHAEHDAHEEAFQIVAPVSGIGERVVQPPDQLGGLDVRRVLVAERPALHPEDEAERLDMRRQVREREGDGLPLVQVVKLEGLEVAHQDEARALAFWQRVEILPGLFVRFAEIAPGALLFDQQHAGPEQVDEARTVVELRDMRLVSRDVPTPHPEHVEEGVVETLRLALLVGRVFPILREGGGADANLVPRQAHQSTLLGSTLRGSRHARNALLLAGSSTRPRTAVLVMVTQPAARVRAWIIAEMRPHPVHRRCDGRAGPASLSKSPRSVLRQRALVRLR